jgi:GT2 family glycosyltransferase
LKILIIIVLYEKRIDELEYLSSFRGEDVLIYDNSPQKQEAPDPVYYRHDPSNPGVSAAYNFGIELARKQNDEAILILDHDTVFDRDQLDQYQASFDKNGGTYIYAPIVKKDRTVYSPYIEGFIRNHVQSMDVFDHEETYDIQGRSLINSGLMIPIQVIDQVGGFNEKIKLDFSDTYFIEQYKKINKKIILLDVFLEHKLSGDEGKDKTRELNRFRYFCGGAREFRVGTRDKLRVDRLVFFRMLRLAFKYFSLYPVNVIFRFYLRNEQI